MPCSTRTRLVVATPTQSAPPISIFAHGKRPVSRVSAQYTENLGVMVERPWALTRDTTVCTSLVHRARPFQALILRAGRPEEGSSKGHV